MMMNNFLNFIILTIVNGFVCAGVYLFYARYVLSKKNNEKYIFLIISFLLILFQMFLFSKEKQIFESNKFTYGFQNSLYFKEIALSFSIFGLLFFVNIFINLLMTKDSQLKDKNIKFFIKVYLYSFIIGIFVNTLFLHNFK